MKTATMKPALDQALYDEQVERALLAEIMIDPGLIDGLHADDFYIEKHQAVFRAIATIGNPNLPVDLIALNAFLKKRNGGLHEHMSASWLAELASEAVSAQGAAQHAGILKDYSERRRLKRELGLSIQAISDGRPLDNIYKTLQLAAARDSQETDSGARRLELVRADTITIERTDWAWAGKIPHRALSAVVGDPDVGKTMLCLDLAARGTVGKLDGLFRGSSFNAIVASMEDSPSHTLVPRLRAAGADLSKIHFIKMKRGDDDGGGLSLPDDLPLLEQEIKRVGAKLLIIDPLMSHLGDGLNSNKDQDIRKALSPLAKLAEESGVTVIVICHLNKNESASSKYRIGGSVGIFAVPRSVLLAGEDPETEGGCVLVHLKCNVGEKAESLRYAMERRLVRKDDGNIVETGVIIWGAGAVGVTAESVLNHKRDPHERSAVQECSDWLSGYLGDLALNVKDIHAEALKNGFKEATLRRAKEGLNIQCGKNGFGKEGVWTWRLPKVFKGAQETTKDAQCPTDDHLRQTPQKITHISNGLLKGAQSSGIEHLSNGDEHLNEGGVNPWN